MENFKSPKTHEFYTPSGIKAIIREQNGNDDEVISRTSDVKAHIAFNKFIQGILVEYDGDSQVKLQTVKEMKLRDKYYILLQSRIFSLGADFHFNWSWTPNGAPTEYVEDLNRYCYDYSKPELFPHTEDMPGYFEFLMPPYKTKDRYHEFTTTSGKQLRFRFQDGLSEIYMMEATEETNTKNTELYARGFQMLLDGSQSWITITSFTNFSARDMREIRAQVKLHDPAYELTTQIVSDNGEVQNIPLVMVQDFYFPEEI